MPKKVDHEKRRAEIAAAALRVAGRYGVQGVTFREVAAEAGISVALVQHYFGTKQNLLKGAVDHLSTRMAKRFGEQLAALGPGARPFEQLLVIAMAFLPTDHDSRQSMIFYHGVGAMALSDPALQGPAVHNNARLLTDTLAALIRAAQSIGEITPDVDAQVQARLLLAIVLGLSSSVLVDNDTIDDAIIAVQTFLNQLRP